MASIDRAAPVDLGVVLDPTQEPVGDPGRAAGPAGDLAGAVGVDGDAEDPGGPDDDRLEVVRVVVLEAGHQAEPVPQRSGDEPGAGRGADQGEPGQRHADRAGGRPLAHQDVELEVLHGRVEHLFDRPGQPVDLVDEQHVAVLELGEDGGQVTGPLQRRTRGDVQGHAHLVRHDPRQRGLAQAGRPGEEQVVDRLAALSGGLEHDAQVVLQLGLADEVGQGSGPQPALGGQRVAGVDLLVDDRLGRQDLVTHGPALPRRQALEGVFEHRARIAGRRAPRGGPPPPRRRRSPVRAGPRAPRRWRWSAARIRRRRRRKSEQSVAVRSRSGRSSAPFSSISSRVAVFLPTPGTRQRAPTSSSATIRRKPPGS